MTAEGLLTIVALSITGGVLTPNVTAADDPLRLWQSLLEPAFVCARTAEASNVVLSRDRATITLAEGVIQFAQSEDGIVFGAAYRGRGRLKITPPNPIEARQLRRFIGRDTVDMEFTEATFTFSDGTYDELSPRLVWTAAASAALADLYMSRQRQREEAGAGILPRVLLVQEQEFWAG